MDVRISYTLPNCQRFRPVTAKSNRISQLLNSITCSGITTHTSVAPFYNGSNTVSAEFSKSCVWVHWNIQKKIMKCGNHSRPHSIQNKKKKCEQLGHNGWAQQCLVLSTLSAWALELRVNVNKMCGICTSAKTVGVFHAKWVGSDSERRRDTVRARGRGVKSLTEKIKIKI